MTLLHKLKYKKLYKKYEENFDELFNNLKEFKEYEDNWNQYGAKKFTPHSIKNMEYFLKDFKKSILSHSAIMCDELIFHSLLPEIFPRADNTIQFEIEPNRNFYFEYTLGSGVNLSDYVSSIYMRIHIEGTGEIKLNMKKLQYIEVILYLKLFYLRFIDSTHGNDLISDKSFVKLSNSIILA